MSKYRVCPFCGSNLDFGERCDCKEKAAKEGLKGAEAKADQNGTVRNICVLDRKAG